MPRPHEDENVGVRHGRWGEDVAAEQLRLEGLTVIERNVRPCPDDRRIEIDIIAYDRRQDVLVFVEVKQTRRGAPTSGVCGASAGTSSTSCGGAAGHGCGITIGRARTAST